MYFGPAYVAGREFDQADSLSLSPVAVTVHAAEAPEFPNRSSGGERPDFREWTDKLEVHAESCLSAAAESNPPV